MKIELSKLNETLRSVIKKQEQAQAVEVSKSDKKSFATAVKMNDELKPPTKSKVANPGKFNPEKVSVKDISDSKWIGKDFYYLATTMDNNDKWIKNEELKAETLIADFHATNPGAAKFNDYESANAWRTVQRKSRYLNKKITMKKDLTPDDIEFIAKGLNTAPEKPKEFERLHLKIVNKRGFKNCTYNQKIKIMQKIIHSYGLVSAVVRISFIGDSVVELYIQKEAENSFKTGMMRNGWNFVENFDFYEMRNFDGKTISDAEKDKCHKALIQRLAFLSASTHLVNLQQCILSDLKEETVKSIINRKEEIIELRAGDRTAYVQKNL